MSREQPSSRGMSPETTVGVLEQEPLPSVLQRPVRIRSASGLRGRQRRRTALQMGVITGFTVLLAVGLLLLERRRRRETKQAASQPPPAPSTSPNPALGERKGGGSMGQGERRMDIMGDNKGHCQSRGACLTSRQGRESHSQSQVNETSRKEMVENLKTFYEICQRENISPDDAFKEIEKWILEQYDPKLCITEQLNKENDKIQNDLKEINKKLLKIHEEIINTDNKALRNVRKEIENKKNELEKKRNALEIDENLVNELKEIISKPTVDLMKPMIDLCDMKIEEMSAAHKIQEEEAYEWVKTVLERKVLQAHPPAGHSLSPLHPRGVPHSRGIGILPHQSAAQRQGRIYMQSSPFSPGQHNGSAPRGAVSEERPWRDRPGSAPVHTDPPQQPDRARERLEGGKELRERKRKIQEEMMNIIAQFSTFLERESALGKSYSEMEETVNKMYKMLVERFIAFGGCGRDLEKLKKELNRLMFLSKYPHKSEARI